MAIEDEIEAGGDGSRSGERRAPPSAHLEEVKTDLAAVVDAHPVGALAAALGLGYVLGGGVFTRLTSRLVRFGLRLGVQLAVVPLLESEAASIMGLERGPDGPLPPEPPDRGRTRH